MLNPTRLIVGMACSSAIVLSACSHDWENLSRDEASESSSSSASSGSSSSGGAGGGGGSSTTSSSSSSASSSSSSSGGTGGSGGGNECGQLLPSVPQCGNLTGTFDSQSQFNADWYLNGAAGQLTAVNGEAHLLIGPGDSSVFAATHPDFTFQKCSIWVQIVEADGANDVMVRLSLSNPAAQSRYSLGVLAQNLAAYSGDVNLFSVPYNANEMRFVRMREEAGMVHFGHSSDGKCWTEIGKVMNTLQGNVEGRIAVTHVPAGNGTSGDGRFDNYCVTMP